MSVYSRSILCKDHQGKGLCWCQSNLQFRPTFTLGQGNRKAKQPFDLFLPLWMTFYISINIKIKRFIAKQDFFTPSKKNENCLYLLWSLGQITAIKLPMYLGCGTTSCRAFEGNQWSWLHGLVYKSVGHDWRGIWKKEGKISLSNPCSKSLCSLPAFAQKRQQQLSNL